MDRSLNTLSSPLRVKIFELLARLTERGVHVMIVQTGRTLEEHAANLLAGTSGTKLSKHLPRSLRGPAAESDKCDAIDLCLFETYQLHGPDKLQWDGADPAWKIIGEEAEKLDLRWGGRWRKPVDPGHCELILTPADRTNATEERTRT